ncbi:hypothetical protein D6201_04625 [Aurantiacibacter aquimixticola]|uniref:Uncharacterized protein n=1 Tax=Aurantiacibacter aquimixticola TaxID=1958945 RepID=A0A419RSH8_9SPHN|nr:hypothetical protein D6201_04625 [Aurantiacibacter aquimixticola]
MCARYSGVVHIANQIDARRRPNVSVDHSDVTLSQGREDVLIDMRLRLRSKLTGRGSQIQEWIEICIRQFANDSTSSSCFIISHSSIGSVNSLQFPFIPLAHVW